MPNRAGNHVEGVFHMSQSTITPEEFARLVPKVLNVREAAWS